MKILFLKGNSLYGTLRVYSDLLIAELRKQGYCVEILDRTIEGQWENLINSINDSYDMVLSYQMLSFKAKKILNDAGKDTSNIKFVCLCGDHPIYLNYWLKAMKESSKNIYLLLGDKNQLDCIRKYYPWITSNTFEKTLGSGIKNIKDYSERSIEVFFGGTYYDVNEEICKIEKMPEKDKKISYMLIDEIKNNEGLPLEKALEIILMKNNKKLTRYEFIDYMELFIPVDRYLRGYYRNMYIEAAIDAGAKVSIFGYNWEKSSFAAKKNFIILEGEHDLNKGFEYMADSKIILNIMPWSRQGMHDRIVGALKAGGNLCYKYK